MKILGPYKIEGYMQMVFKHDDGTRSAQMYHRYLWEQAYGPLAPGVHVHHIDGNPMNNSLDNLRPMPVSDHHRLHNPITAFPVKFACPWCGAEASKKKKEYDRRKRQGQKGPFCGRTCAQRYNGWIRRLEREVAA